MTPTHPRICHPEIVEKVPVPIERLLALSIYPNVGVKTLNQLLDAHQEFPSSTWNAQWLRKMSIKQAPLARVISDGMIPEGLLRKAQGWILETQKIGARIVTRVDSEYPQRLLHIYEPPPFLWLRGNIEALKMPLLSVVGTRRPTHAAVRETKRIVEDCARAGLGIVSGLAQGIDQVAHRAALDGGGVTLAVFGSGINRVYPAQHRALAKEMLQQGGLHISEFPPGAPPAKHHFVKRNRIISGLSRACLLGQSALKGGSMITQSYVKEQDRDFYAIPYAPSEPQSGGSLYALRDGATLTRSAKDILSESYKEILTDHECTSVDSSSATIHAPTLLQSEILRRCQLTPVSIDVLMQAMPNQRSEVLYALLELEWHRRIKRLPGDQYIRLE